VLAVALQAIGHPGQVQPGHQGHVKAALQLPGQGVERVIAKQQIAVHGGHQGRGVGQQVFGGGGHLRDVFGLCLCDGLLFIGAGCASSLVAPGAQPFRYQSDVVAAGT
jgi:hypothetical protein